MSDGIYYLNAIYHLNNVAIALANIPGAPSIDDLRDEIIAFVIERGEPREWELMEDGCIFDKVMACSGAEALDMAPEPKLADYGQPSQTIFGELVARCPVTGEIASQPWELHPAEPRCASGHEHDWAHLWTRGHGPGVLTESVCAHCGWIVRTDTGATDPRNGSQGATVIRYIEPGE